MSPEDTHVDYVTRRLARLVCIPLLLFLFSAVIEAPDGRD
jgi:hypothetical protein